MSYVDAFHDRERDIIHVVERSTDGRRIYQQYPVNWVFYYEDPKGKFRSVNNESLSRFSTRKRSEFQKELRLYSGKKTFESDINPVFRCLAENYLDSLSPKLHACFFDIEVNFDPEKGFAPPSDPFNSVTAISMYLTWLDQLITLVIAPNHMTEETANNIVSQFDNTILFQNEVDMFNVFFDLIEDADVLSGWNSSGYDIPYMVNRVSRVMSKDDTRRFCLLNQFPKLRKYVMFDQEQETYDLSGRVHMDYLELYKKYNYESRHSYKLDFIGEMEVDEKKVQYEGTLDQLYNKDFKKFIEYNRQDTMLLFKIHKKLKFLDLASDIAHQNTVLMQTVMGSVAMIEQAIINEAHSRGFIIPDKRKVVENDEAKAAGAYVATPKRGMHEWIAAVDINSLYPSAIRALNMAPETIVGQLRPTMTDDYIAKKIASGLDFPQAWEGLFGSLEYLAVMNQERDTLITVDWENGESEIASAAEIWKLIFDSNQPWIISANGTIFTYEKEGIIPGLLTKWYTERKQIQKQLKQSTDKEEQEFYDKRQLVRKILLNSAYGALLNPHCRFNDIRIGQSTTLCGRQIVKHMGSHLNEQITGTYDHTGEAVIYGDTDSIYFSAWSILKNDQEFASTWDKDVAVQLYDQLAENTNTSFPDFMQKAFHCPKTNGSIIKAGRELVADRGIFITKKRYAVNIYDKEGDRLDQYDEAKANKKGVIFGMGKIKAMGLDLKRADTPKYVQNFLMSVLIDTLKGTDRDTIVNRIREFKLEMIQKPSYLLGSPKGVKKLTTYGDQMSKTDKKVNMPGHVRASLNWNYLRVLNSDNYSQKIVDGMKIVVCKLKPNLLGMTSIAYPTDELRLPQWFLELPFDDGEMIRTLVDEKIENLLGILNWNIRQDINVTSTFNSLFTFG